MTSRPDASSSLITAVRLWTAALVVGIWLSPSAVVARTNLHALVYAAPNGTGRQCVPQAPCNLLEARAKERNLLAESNPPVQVTVVLADGTYRLSQPLKFGRADSGTREYPVNWSAAPGATPIFSGAVRVTDWRDFSPSEHIFSAVVPLSADTRQLYVNGVEVPVASITPTDAHVAFAPVKGGYTVTPTSWIERLTRRVAKENLKRIEFVFTGANGAWTQSFCRIDSIFGDSIRMQQPCWWNVTHRTVFHDATGGLPAMPADRPPTIIRNAYALLQPGQWYLDVVTHTLYYRLVGNQHIDELDIEMPRLQELVQTTSSNNGANDITFSGITFAYATWLGPSSNAGFADVQDNLRLTQSPGGAPQGMCEFSDPPGTCPFGALVREPGNVTIDHGSRINFVHDVFEHLGAAGIVLENGSSYDGLSGDIFHDIAGNAIIIGNPKTPTVSKKFINDFNQVNNNVIFNIGTDYPSAAAVTLFFTQHSVISHNDIYGVPYDGISDGVVQGHVDNADHPNNSSNVNAGNVIEYNLIHGFMQVLHDGGAIYIEGHQGPGGPTPQSAEQWTHQLELGLVVRGNVAYDQGHANYTWYDDAGADWIKFWSNVEWGSGDGGGQGGCQPVGNISYTDNFGSHPIANWACTPPSPAGVIVQHNTAIPVLPTASELPMGVLRQAGPTGRFRLLEMTQAPHVSYVRTERSGYMGDNTDILIAGADFIPRKTSVEFLGGARVAADVINNGMLIAHAPRGSNPCVVRIVTPAGTADGACAAHSVEFWTKAGDK